MAAFMASSLAGSTLAQLIISPLGPLSARISSGHPIRLLFPFLGPQLLGLFRYPI